MSKKNNKMFKYTLPKTLTISSIEHRIFWPKTIKSYRKPTLIFLRSWERKHIIKIHNNDLLFYMCEMYDRAIYFHHKSGHFVSPEPKFLRPINNEK